MESIFISMITQEQEAGMEVRYQVASDHEGQELRRFIKGKREFSSALWKRVKWNGKVLINGMAVHNARTVLHKGDEVILSWSEENEVVPSDIPLSIVYEDEDVLVVNKGPGMIIHPTSRNTHDTLVNAVAGYFERNHRDAGIHPVYRLDRNTTGLVVVAKSAWGSMSCQRVMTAFTASMWLLFRVGWSLRKGLSKNLSAGSPEVLWNGWYGLMENGRLRNIGCLRLLMRPVFF